MCPQASRSSELVVDHIIFAIVAHMAYSPGGYEGPGTASTRRSFALARNAVRRKVVAANLDGDFSVMLLPPACGFSAKHLSWAVRQSIGLAPHQWLLQRRIDKARQRGVPLVADVATDCGFAHQSRFTRVFLRGPLISIPVNGSQQSTIETASPHKAALEPFGLRADAARSRRC
jgi:AraC family transcriptional regulator